MTELPAIAHRPSTLTLFRFSAVSWNAHRIHYDETYARSEGHDGIVVHSTLRGQHLLEVVERWLGDRGRVEAFAWQNRRPAYAEQPVVCRGRVATEDGEVLTIELEEVDDEDRVGATGRATVRIRTR